MPVKSWRPATAPPMGRPGSLDLGGSCVGASGRESGGRGSVVMGLFYSSPPPPHFPLTDPKMLLGKQAAWPPLNPLVYHREPGGSSQYCYGSEELRTDLVPLRPGVGQVGRLKSF